MASNYFNPGSLDQNNLKLFLFLQMQFPKCLKGTINQHNSTLEYLRKLSFEKKRMIISGLLYIVIKKLYPNNTTKVASIILPHVKTFPEHILQSTRRLMHSFRKHRNEMGDDWCNGDTCTLMGALAIHFALKLIEYRHSAIACRVFKNALKQLDMAF